MRWACFIRSLMILGIEIFGVEAAGHGLTNLHAASIAGGRPGVLHGNRTYLLMDDDGQIQDAHSISAGLDYPGIGPEHSWLHETGRVTYLSATDDEALAAFLLLSRLEGIIPALEPAHAIAKVMDLAPKRPKDHLMVVNLSGRGDKDVPQVGDILKGKKEVTTRIDTRFDELKKEGRAAFVTFVMCGDPDLATSLEIIKALPKAGADIIEIGMPFTDPMADGPAIQAAGLRALKGGTTLKKTLQVVRDFRKGDDVTPVVLMGYYNPIYIYGVDKFLPDAKAAGVDGLIIVDLPPEEDTELCLPAMKAGLNFIRLATPTTDDKRLPAVLANTSGFVYYVSITGITGSASADTAQVSSGGCTHQASHAIAGMRRLRHSHAGGSSRHRAGRQRCCRRLGADRCLEGDIGFRGPRHREDGSCGGRSGGGAGAGRTWRQAGCGIAFFPVPLVGQGAEPHISG